MSDMEIFYGKFKVSDRDVTIEDTDEFYDLEEALGVHFVEVNDITY